MTTSRIRSSPDYAPKHSATSCEREQGVHTAALVVGPTGLAFDEDHDVLYVASTGDNEIFAVPDARMRSTDAGIGTVIYSDSTHLHGPLALVLAPNGT